MSFPFRLFPRAELAVVEAAASLVGGVLPRAAILDPLIIVKPPVVQESSATGHGHLLVFLVHGESIGRSRTTWTT